MVTPFRAFRKLVLFGVTLLLLVLLPILIALSIGLNPITGEYRYDPRTGTPAAWLLANPPEQSVVDYMRGQVTGAGTFPPGALYGVQSMEATDVRADVYTDWQTPAEVTVQLHYSDNTTGSTTFRVYSGASRGIELGPFALSYDAQYPPLNLCEPTGPGEYECRP